MKKLFLTIGLVATASLAFGQGTIALSNSGFQRLSSASSQTSPLTTIIGALPTTANYITFTFWYGSSAGNLTQLTGVSAVNSSTSAGVIANASDGKTTLSLVAMPSPWDVNTQPFFQIRATSSDGAWAGATPVIQTMPLGASPSGPAAALWQGNTGVNPNLFKPNDLILTPVPEPTTIALMGLGAAGLLIFRRRK